MKKTALIVLLCLLCAVLSGCVGTHSFLPRLEGIPAITPRVTAAPTEKPKSNQKNTQKATEPPVERTNPPQAIQLPVGP